MKGTVKFFDDVKNYGFIEPDHKKEKDHFVHRNEIRNGHSLEERDRVEFDSDEYDVSYPTVHLALKERGVDD